MTVATAFFDLAQTATDCICDQMDSLAGGDGIPDDYGCPCDPYVSAGEPDVDCCTTDCEGGGMLAVYVEDVFPSDNFPLPISTFEPCKAATWVAVLVVTVARCARPMDEQGTPDLEASTAAARLLAIDRYAVLTALGCCLVADAPPNKRKRRVLITDSRSLVSEGGCASIEIRASVEAGAVCACPGGES